MTMFATGSEEPGDGLARRTVEVRTMIADFSERLAVCASAACLVHCLVLPMVILLLPTLTSVLDIPETFHLWVLGLAIPCAGLALLVGWRRHGRTAPLFAGCVGLALLAIGALAVGETIWEVPVTVAGSLTLAAAHITNWRLRHRFGCECEAC